ncbi:MAG: carboxylesterase family protein [Acidaminococcaceae bacterium]|nr:carboxylesterase family protein [Acidaminococcaceae bacterium]
MKKSALLSIFAVLATASIGFAAGNDFMVKCHNGYFVGTKEQETGVLSFKGIPYAQQPVGPLRWKAPLPLPGSKNVYQAKEFGVVPLQIIDIADVDDLANAPTDENCLNINVWTADLTTKKKPVMFYIHGGAYGWEGARSTFYDMQYMVKENPDIVLVTFDYRVNSLGFFDLSKVPDGKVYKSSDFKDSGYLGVLDTIAALKWTKKNIAAFGGDPDNITVFGESAGGGLTSIMLATKPPQGLFKRVIIQSGALNLTMNQETFDALNQTGAIMEATGAKNMDDMMALKKEDILKAWSLESGRMGTEGETLVQNLNNHPLRGGNSIISENPLNDLVKGLGKDVDVMIGTTTDEWRYWINEAPGNLNQKIHHLDMINRIKTKQSCERSTRTELVDAYLKIARTKNSYWDKNISGFGQRVELINDVAFRIPAIKLAEAHIHAKGKGKTYMYYFAKESDKADWAGAPHASELPYVFYNPKLGGTAIYGTTDMALAKKVCRAWTNFARTGIPSSDDFVWEQYDLSNRKTLVIKSKDEIKMVNDPLPAQRVLLDAAGLYQSF